MDAQGVIKYPVSTEKSLRTMEAENKLLFVVEKKATKADVKRAVEALFKVKVIGVNTFIIAGKKKAYVKLGAESPAIDIATQLGMM
ncbi:50S ribosomal protein L23 [Candidatus Woesearchaeota archaeon]|nr:50S ribosomal protein L23 [Candidatus Woesearchaeota archaeon]